MVASILKVSPSSIFGSGTCFKIKSNKGSKFSPFLDGSSVHHPSLPTAYNTGKSNCWSFAPKAQNKSKISYKTSFGLASCLSILLITTIGLIPNFKAFESTNLVCGNGPSAESTNKTTPSTIDKIRSTSPPKSACPGVSTIFILVPLCSTDVTFAKIVIPLSLSRSPLSITLSATASLFLKVPLCFNI